MGAQLSDLLEVLKATPATLAEVPGEIGNAVSAAGNAIAPYAAPVMGPLNNALDQPFSTWTQNPQDATTYRDMLWGLLTPFGKPYGTRPQTPPPMPPEGERMAPVKSNRDQES